MTTIFEGNPKKGKCARIAVVVSRFNDFISKRLLKRCLTELTACGVLSRNVVVAWVPGSFEIPLVAKRFAEDKKIDAVICLGAVIRGETYHFEMVAQAATQGIAAVSRETGKPVIFGVLTTDTIEQAYKRAEDDGDNKGADAARTAVEMITLLSQCGR